MSFVPSITRSRRRQLPRGWVVVGLGLSAWALLAPVIALCGIFIMTVMGLQMPIPRHSLGFQWAMVILTIIACAVIGAWALAILIERATVPL